MGEEDLKIKKSNGTNQQGLQAASADQSRREPMVPKVLAAFFKYLLIGLLLTIVLNYVFGSFIRNSSSEEITYTEFLEKVDDGMVSQVVIEENQINIVPNDTDKSDRMFRPEYYYTGKVDDPDLTRLLKDKGVVISQEIPTEASPIISFYLPGSSRFF